MAYINNKKGDAFVVPSYRDLVTEKLWEIKKNILSLSTTYGEYVNLQQVGISQFSVVFSHEPGFLFGECVWAFLNKPFNLIYCELNPNQELYLVIIKNGTVYLDGVYSDEDLSQELLVITTQNDVFDFYVYGDVPISREEKPGKVFLKPELIKSFTILPTSLVDDLLADSSYQLQLADILINKQEAYLYPLKYIVAVIVLLMILLLVYYSKNRSAEPVTPVESADTSTAQSFFNLSSYSPLQNLFNDYNNAFNTPNPTLLMISILAKLDDLLNVENLTIIGLNYTKNTITFNATMRQYGNLYLRLQNQGYAVSLDDSDKTGNTSKISFDLNLPSRGGMDKIYSLNQLIGVILDKNRLMFPDVELTLGAITDHVQYKDSTLSGKFDRISPNQLILFIKNFNNLPAVLKTINFTLNDDGISGTIEIQLLGS